MMRKFLPPGLLGLVIASLIAAFMSTIDTHSNWGASYLVRDLYVRFLDPDADQRTQLRISRLSVVGITLTAGIVSFFITDIAAVWKFIITLGAGLGSVTAARWYWKRVTPHAEFAALAVTSILAVSLQLGGIAKLGEVLGYPWMTNGTWFPIVLVASASLAVWVPVALFGPQNAQSTLEHFYAKVTPGGPGWRGVGSDDAHFWVRIFQTLLGTLLVFGTLFGLGGIFLGQGPMALGGLGGALLAGVGVWRLTPRN